MAQFAAGFVIAQATVRFGALHTTTIAVGVMVVVVTAVMAATITTKVVLR